MISWIGSFQLFMQYAPAVVAGRAFDKGYLYVSVHDILFDSTNNSQ